MRSRPGTRLAFHHVGVDRVGGEAERGQTVGDEIDPEQVNRQQRHGQTDEHADGHEQEFPGVAGQQVLEGLADVVVNAAAFLDGGDDGGEVVIGDDHVRGLLGDFRARFSHGDADVGALDGGRVVDAIAGHRDHGVVRLSTRG
jgi:hypothetical protein